MRGVIRWMIRGEVIDNSGFTEPQKEQILCLQNAFIGFISRDGRLPEYSLLSTEERGGMLYAKEHPLKSGFDLSAWIGKMREKTFFSSAVEDMVTVLCAYQRSRYQVTSEKGEREWSGFFSTSLKDYLHEPVQLFCEEFKRWLVFELSSADCTPETLAELQRRIFYLDQLISAKEFLPNHAACSEQPDGTFLLQDRRTIFWVLLELHRKLTMEVRPRIELEIARSSAREHIEPVLSAFSQIFHYGVAFLLCVLNDKAALLDDFSLSNISRDIPGPGYREYLETPAGKRLKQLVDIRTQKTDLLLTPGESTFSADLAHVGVGAGIGIETVVEAAAVEVNPFWRLDLAEYEPLKKVGSGLNIHVSIRSTRTSSETTDIFLLAHGLLAEFYYLEESWQAAYQMAGSGGNLLVYGFANEEVNKLLGHTETNIKIFEAVLNELYRRANDYYISRYRINDLSETVWLGNFKLALSYYELLMLQLNKLHRRVQKIRIEANAVSFSERLEKAQGMFSALLDRIKNQVERTSLISGVAFPMTTERAEVSKKEKRLGPGSALLVSFFGGASKGSEDSLIAPAGLATYGVASR